MEQTMKRTRSETRYEHEGAIFVVKEQEGGSTEVSVFKREVVGKTPSQWGGSVLQLSELAEGIRFLFQEHPSLRPTLNAAGVDEARTKLHGFHGEGKSVDGPVPDPGRVVLQVSTKDFEEMVRCSNAIIERPPASLEALLLARLVSRALAGGGG